MECIGRPRKPEHLKKTTIFVNIPNPLLWKINEEAERQNLKTYEMIVKILKEKYNM